MAETADATVTEPALRTRFLSHGTLGSKDLERTRRFYTEFLGLEVVRTSKISLLVRLGGDHTYAVVQNKKLGEMPRINHNGLDVEDDAEVDRSYETVVSSQQVWGLHKITKPVAQHGTYSFHFWDRDENCWEILSNPDGGYTWLFERGDQEGKGHQARDYDRPES
jgi:catechol 2,3-dioxygenase-like lactoylglutathione lyase family enzyme